MKTRELGRLGLKVSEQALGCMSMSEFYGTPDQDEAIATIKLAVELGITLFDTADAYGPYTNEELVGRVLGPIHDTVQIATKFGLVRGQGTFTEFSGSPEYVRKACDASLQRLGIDYIDLYYQHRTDPQVPIEDTVGAMSELVIAGKIKYLGLSEVSPEVLRRAHAVHPLTALQTEWSLFSRDCESSTLPVARELGIGFVAYSPLGRGMLTGKLVSSEDLASDDYRRYLPRFRRGSFEHNVAIANRLQDIALRKKTTSGQIALAWLAAQGEDVVTLPGTKRRTYLQENIEATNMDLSPEEISEIDELFPLDSAEGNRYRNMDVVF